MFRAAVPSPWMLMLMMMLLVPSNARADLSCDHFNYGSSVTPLTACSGGENWNGAWWGYDALSPCYCPTCNMTYSSPCYSSSLGWSHESNDLTGGGAGFQSYRDAYRYFPHQLTGVVWVSALFVLGGNAPFGSFGIGGNYSGTFWFGRPSSYSSGHDVPCIFLNGSVRGIGTHHLDTGATHLLIAKLEFDYDASGNDRVTMWVDPADLCNGEAGLGVPEASADGYDVGTGWSILTLGIGNGSAGDAVRVSHGSSASLSEVLGPVLPTAASRATWGELKATFR